MAAKKRAQNAPAGEAGQDPKAAPDEQPLFCPNCSQPLSPLDFYCPACGTVLAAREEE